MSHPILTIPLLDQESFKIRMVLFRDDDNDEDDEEDEEDEGDEENLQGTYLVHIILTVDLDKGIPRFIQPLNSLLVLANLVSTRAIVLATEASAYIRNISM